MFLGTRFDFSDMRTRSTLISIGVMKCPPLSQAPQARCEYGRQKFKELYENPEKKLKQITI